MQVDNHTVHISKSVDSLCRDGADAQYMQYLSKSCITSPQTRKKLILSAQASFLSAFVSSKTHICGQKSRGRQINTKVCVSKSAIFVILSFFLVTTFVQTTISRKLFKYSPSF